jgi:hypothetical protein
MTTQKPNAGSAALTPEDWLGSVLARLCADLDMALRSGPLFALAQVWRDLEAMMRR